ncbi:MAG TPA: flagellin, partial [Bacteroidetes bacterium]|nr:flagellin [Bacteroidota bacterium]
MSMRINHNILSMTAQRNLWSTQNDLDRAVTRLSSGLRINNAWDDPAGLAISERFRAQISSMEEAERNANNNINLMQTAEGALSVIDEKLVRMRALAIEASNGSLLSTDREALDVEYQQLVSEINRIAQVTNYNGLALLDGS